MVFQVKRPTNLSAIAHLFKKTTAYIFKTGLLHKAIPIIEIGFQGCLHVGVVQVEANEIPHFVFVPNALALRLPFEYIAEQTVFGKNFTGVTTVPTFDCWTTVLLS